ncbi:DoxX family protein [Aquabacterium humicola]|uniref:DoxX family protein n=1 Tax=Aquabacterium humicola TaxID=3237377 RepID=UPI00254363AD|nr:DoxX family protein [Rubrivivax pictus]
MNPSSTLRALAAPAQRITQVLEALQPLALLAARLYVAKVFFYSGLTKLRDWDTTLALFMDEYHVPLLPPMLAALLGTAAEVLLPVLLAVGLATRFGAFGLFFVNAVAVIALPEITDAALQQHLFWGSLLVGLVLWGPGRWSADHWLVQRWCGGAAAAPR